MSSITGQAPKVYVNSNTTTSVNDQNAIKILLNDNSNSNWSSTTKDMSLDGLGKNLSLTTSSNKSLILSEGISLSQPGNLSANGANFITNQSSIIYAETLQFRLDSPDNGVYNTSTPSGLVIQEDVATSQSDLDKQAAFRYAPVTDDWTLMSDKVTAYGGPSFLGVEGGYANDNGTLTPYAPYGTLADNGFELKIDKTSNNLGSYNYAQFKIGWSDATVNINNTSNILTNSDDTNIEQTSVPYPEWESSSYHGNMSQSDYNNFGTVDLSVIVSPPLQNGSYVNKVFSLSEGTGDLVNVTNDSLNISEVGDSFPKTDLTVNIVAGQKLVRDNVVFNDNLTLATNLVENLPQGKTESDATVSFDSSSRTTNTLGVDGINMGAQVSVIYESDNASSTQDVNGDTIGVLSDTLMKTESVSYSGTILFGSTLVQENANNISSKNSNGMVFFMQDSNKEVTISNVDSNQNTVFGVLEKANQVTLTEKADGTLFSLNPDVNDYKLCSNDCPPEILNNSVNGSQISGTIKNVDILQEGGSASNGLRLLFKALDLFENFSITKTQENLNESNNPTVVRRSDQLVVYDINSDNQGPVSIYNYPVNDSTYSQTYDVIFPSGDKALSTNAAMSSLSKTVVPTSVKINGFAGNEKITETEIDIKIVPSGDNANFVEITQQDQNGQRTVSGKLIIPLSLSGVDNVTGNIHIPISYTYILTGSNYNNGPRYINNLVPKLTTKLNVKDLNIAYTHEVYLQGSSDVSNTTKDPKIGTWTNIINYAGLIDLRLINTNVNLSSDDQKVSVTFDVYPRDDIDAPSYYSVDYVLGADWTSGQWSASFTNDISLFKNSPTLTKENIASILTNSTLTNLSVSQVDVGSEITVNVSGGVDFSATMQDTKLSTLYFARVSKSIVSIGEKVVVIENGDKIKVDDGVCVSFSNLTSTSSQPGKSILSFSLNKDKFVATAYAGQELSGWNSPWTTLGSIPSSLVLIPEGPESENPATNNVGPYFYESIPNSQGITSYTIRQVKGDTTASGVPDVLTISWELYGTDNPDSGLYYVIDKRNGETDWTMSSDEWTKFNTTLTLTEPKTFNTTYNQTKAFTHYLFMYRAFDTAFPESIAQFTYLPGIRIEFFNNETKFFTSNISSPACTFSNALVNYQEQRPAISPYTTPGMFTGKSVINTLVDDPDSNGNIISSKNLFKSIAITSGISSLIYRGFANGSSYNFHRGKVSLTVTWGQDSESFDVSSPSTDSTVTQVFNLSKNYGINLVLNRPPSVNETITFSPNIADVTIRFNGVEIIRKANTFDLTVDQNGNTITTIPWLEKFKLNHFFTKSFGFLSVYLGQSDLLIEKQSSFIYDEGANWDYVVSINEITMKAMGNTLFTIPSSNLSLKLTGWKNRKTSKHFFVVVRPFSYSTFLAGFSTQANHSGYITSTPFVVDLPESKGKLTFTSSFNTLALKNTSQITYTFIKTPYLLTVRGTQMNTSLPNINWNTYISSEPMGPEIVRFLQQNTISSAENYLTLGFDSVQIPKIYPNDGWSGYITIFPARALKLTQYLLKFEIDSVTRKSLPFVYKLVSASFDGNAIGPSIIELNITGSGGTRDLNGGFLNKFQTYEMYKTSLSLGENKVLDFPYNYLSSTDYPTLGFGSSVTPTFSFTKIEKTDPTFMKYLDLLVNIRDYTITNGVPTYSTTGSTSYKEILVADENKQKYTLIFNRDQLVVKNHLGNLSMRVGPDGQLYTSGISSYTLFLNDNLSHGLDNLYNVPLNTVAGVQQPNI